MGDLLVPDTQKVDADRPTTLRLNLLAAEVSRQGLLSKGQLARLLNLDRVELRRFWTWGRRKGVRPMGSLTCLTDPAALIAADTSAVINLNATGCAVEILRAIPNKLMVVDVVRRELEEGRLRGRRDADLLEELVAAGLAQIGELGDLAAVHFEKLVVGPAAMTLADGEAATISCAVAHCGIAILDERKAPRLCADLFPELSVGSTVDMLRYPQVQDGLGKEMLSESVFRALQDGRMRVFPHHIEWVVGMIEA